MWSLRAKGVALAGASAAVGATAGVCHERRKRHLSPVQRRPGHPLFGTVSAATPVAPAPVAPAPVVVVPEVPIPSKETGLPTEPLPGTNRIAEIMRFGFPGLDNIRSRRCGEKNAFSTSSHSHTCIIVEITSFPTTDEHALLTGSLST